MNGMNKLNREIFFKKQEEKAVKKVLRKEKCVLTGHF